LRSFLFRTIHLPPGGVPNKTLRAKRIATQERRPAMIILELLVFSVGLVYFWLRTETAAKEAPEELPHLDIGGRFYPK
jgi:hypothetical protein